MAQFLSFPKLGKLILLFADFDQTKQKFKLLIINHLTHKLIPLTYYWTCVIGAVFKSHEFR